jgi:hypothetical protein
MAQNRMIVNISGLKLSIHETKMTLSLERMARLLLGVLKGNGAGRSRIPRLDLMALSERDLADLNLPADVRSRVLDQRHRG